MHFDAILGAELVRHYKPDAEVYRSTPGFLGAAPEEIMMVAAHSSDLEAAQKRAAHRVSHRPEEFGDGTVGVADTAKPGEFDIVASDLIDLARQLGV